MTDPASPSNSRSSTPASTPSRLTVHLPSIRPSLLAVSKGKASATWSKSSESVPQTENHGASTPRKRVDSAPIKSGQDSDHSRPRSERRTSVDWKGKGKAVDDDSDALLPSHHSSEPSTPFRPSDPDGVHDGGSDSDDDNDDAVAYAFPALSEGHEDPRVMLREQLKRGESYRHPAVSPARSRAQSYRGSHPSAPSIHALADDRSSAHSPNTLIQSQELQASLKPSVRVRPRRYIVLSAAGKPVFASRSTHISTTEKASQLASAEDFLEEENSEEALTSLVGVIQAIISLYAVQNDRIKYINAGSLKIAFFLKSPLYLAAVSDWGEPEGVLRTHLEYLYLQLISTVSQAQLHNIFQKRSNYDLRRLLDGTENATNRLLHRLQWNFEASLGCLKVFALDSSLRDECTAALKLPKSSKYPDVLYAILVSHSTIVTLLRPKSHSIHPADLHLLLNTIEASTSLKEPSNESWLPICLPKFNQNGFVHAFISYFSTIGEKEKEIMDNDLRLGVILITGDKEGFFNMREWKEAIYARLIQPSSSPPLLSRLRSVSSEPPLLHSLPIPGLRYWMYKSRMHVQLVSSDFESSPYAGFIDRQRLVTLLQEIREALIPPSRSKGPGAKLVYAVSEHEAVLGMVTSLYEIYLALPPLVPKKVATDSAHALSRWVQKNESRLFLVGAPHF